MPISPKVWTFEKPIRRQDGVESLLRPPNGCVVSDAHLNAGFSCRTAARSRRARNFTHDGLLANRPFASHFRLFLALPGFVSICRFNLSIRTVTGIHSLSHIT